MNTTGGLGLNTTGGLGRNTTGIWVETTGEATVGYVAAGCSLLLYLSPIIVILRHWNNRANGEMVPWLFPFQTLATLFNCVAWVMFGFVTQNALRVAVVNVFGVIIYLIYLVIFYRYLNLAAEVASLVWLGGFVGVFVAGISSLVTFILRDNHSTQTIFTGIECFIFGATMNIFPMTAVVNSCNNRNHTDIEIWISLALFFNGGSWLLYAYLVSNYYSMVTNGIGFVFGLIQVAIYIILRFSTTAQNQQNEAARDTELRQV